MVSSGGYHTVSIDQIIVPERIRMEYGDMEYLQGSISRLILLGPIVTTPDNVLRAGGRRYYACKALGHTHIDCHYLNVDGENDAEAESIYKEIELEENLCRKPLEWPEEVQWTNDFFEYQRSRDPEYNQIKMAKQIGKSQSWVSDRLIVHEEMKNNKALRNESTFSTALGVANRNNRRRVEASTLQIMKSTRETAIINANMCEWAPAYTGQKFNFLHIDFPYGINTEKRQQGNAITVLGSYDDSIATSRRLRRALLENLDRICMPSGHIMFWFPMEYYAETLADLSEHFDIDPYPLIWTKSAGILPDRDRLARRTYETCFYGSWGDIPIVRSIANSYDCQTERDPIHPSTKPEEVLRNFFRMFVDINTSMLDPTCGSGTSVRAAQGMGAKHVLGIDIDKDFVEQANIALEKSRRAIA
jgi:16S rRNA G966 N2-methylase RsmD